MLVTAAFVLVTFHDKGSALSAKRAALYEAPGDVAPYGAAQISYPNFFPAGRSDLMITFGTGYSGSFSKARDFLICQRFDGKRLKREWTLSLRKASRKDHVSNGTLDQILLAGGFVPSGKVSKKIRLALVNKGSYACYQFDPIGSWISCWFIRNNGKSLQKESARFPYRSSPPGFWVPIMYAEQKALGWFKG